MADTELDMTFGFQKLNEPNLTLSDLQSVSYKKEWTGKDLLGWRDWLNEYKTHPKKPVKNSNPHFVPRNFILQTLIEKTEAGDTSLLKAFLAAIETPYEAFSAPHQELEDLIMKMRPDWALNKPGCSALSCSS